MCINNSQDGGSKSCGQAAYVIYNQSAESYMKFKQVVEHVDFNKIDNYEYRSENKTILYFNIVDEKSKIQNKGS